MNHIRKVLFPLALLTASTGAVAGDARLQIEEVVVTAERRSESIQDIPVAITAIQADAIDNMKMETANDVTATVPNLNVASPYGENQPIFSIRGQSMSDYNANQASPVGVYTDEVYVGATFLQGMALFDLDRVEVLRGPQGTLYGKNTTGGAINFITRAPALDGTNGYVTLTLGDYGRKHLDGAVETELLEDKLGVRAAYTYTKTDGHHENFFPGGDDLSEIDTWAGRLSLRYQGDSFGAMLRYATGESDGNTTAVINEGRIPVPGIGDTDAIGALIGELSRLPEWDAWEGSHNKSLPYSTSFDSVALTLDWDLGDYTLTSITSYLDAESLNQADIDGARWRLVEIDYGTDVRQFTQDLRVVSNFDGPFNFILGAYYLEDTTDVENFWEFFLATEDFGLPFSLANNLVTNPTPNAATSGFTTIHRYTQERDSVAAYLHLTYDITDRLGLTAGLRYTKDEGNGRDLHTQLADYDLNPVIDLIAPGSFPDGNAEYDDSAVTGKIGLDYRLNEDTLLYASYSRGYRSSAFNGGAQFAVNEVGIADPEFVNAYELGFKTSLRDGSVQLNGALFYYDYKDQQFVNIIGVQQFLENGDESYIAGFELELISRITQDLTVNAGLGYLNTEFEELTLSDTVNGGTIDLDGNELFNAPEWNFNIAVDYVVAKSDLGLFRVSADTNYIAQQWYSAYNDDLNYGEIQSDSKWVSNARLSWESVSQRISAAVWVKNIGNDDEPTYAANLQGLGFDYFTVGLPRRWGVDFKYRF